MNVVVDGLYSQRRNVCLIDEFVSFFCDNEAANRNQEDGKDGLEFGLIEVRVDHAADHATKDADQCKDCDRVEVHR